LRKTIKFEEISDTYDGNSSFITSLSAFKYILDASFCEKFIFELPGKWIAQKRTLPSESQKRYYLPLYCYDNHNTQNSISSPLRYTPK
jgi:hypothetical protein